MERFAASWGPAKQRKPGDALTLSEEVVLRRKRRGARNIDIARELGWTPASVGSLLYAARKRFGVKTDKELFALPFVAELLGEEPGRS